VCTEYASAIAALTRAATAAAAPSPPPQALLVYRDARQPVPPPPATAQPLPADLRDTAPFGVRDRATNTFVAETDETEREKLATAAAAASSVPTREMTGRREGLDLETHEGFPVREGLLPVGDSSAAGVVGDSVADEIGDGSAAGVLGDSATGVIGDSAAGRV
ncbi:unnamed protein product, partial [Laminaria digitata]